MQAKLKQAKVLSDKSALSLLLNRVELAIAWIVMFGEYL